MLRKRRRICVGTELGKEPRRALHVGEEEGDRSFRQIRSHEA